MLPILSRQSGNNAPLATLDGDLQKAAKRAGIRGFS